MKKLVHTIFVLLLAVVMYGQSNFEDRIKAIKSNIVAITDQEKAELRKAVDEINNSLAKNEISESEAEMKKKAEAEKCADRIEARIEPLEEELQNLIRAEVEEKDDRINNLEEYDNEDHDNVDDNSESDDRNHRRDGDKKWNKKRKTDFNDWSWEWDNWKHRRRRSESRTTTQFVFAFGLNNALTEGDLSSLDDNGIKLSNSRFYEWGFTWKTRLAKNSPWLQIKYGLSLTYNNLRPDNNQYFVKNDKQTVLAEHPFTLRDEPYFRMINLVVPVHFEFDFSKKKVKDDAVVIRTQRSFRVGLGGYAGINTRTKQKLEYKNDGLTTDQTTKGDYNTSNIIYGLSGYIGYRDISLYTKYDLNHLFTDNAIDQNNVSLGLRFDFH